MATDYCCAATVALIGLAGYCTHLADMLSENGVDRRPLLFNPRIPFVLQGISSLQGLVPNHGKSHRFLYGKPQARGARHAPT